jgi:tetratricopeptide (TPR) repeat protein
MKKRRFDKLNWRNKVKNALQKANILLKVPSEIKERSALRFTLFAFNSQKKYAPYNSTFSTILDDLLWLYGHDDLYNPKRIIDIHLMKLYIHKKYFPKEKNGLLEIYKAVVCAYQYDSNNENNERLSNLYKKKEAQLRIDLISLNNEEPSLEFGVIARLFSDIRDIEKQKEYLLKQIDEFERFAFKKSPHLTSQIAYIYDYLKMYDKSLENHFKHLDIQRGRGNTLLVNCYSAIAEGYRNLEDYDRSIEYHLKSIENVINADTTEFTQNHLLKGCYFRTALTYFDMNDFLNAKFHILKSIEIEKKNSDLKYSEGVRLLEKIKKFENKNLV